jgi:minor extracellular serine protease Vpr
MIEGRGMFKGIARLLAGATAIAVLLVIPGLAAGAGSSPGSSDQLRAPQAYFVQLAGSPSALGGSKAQAKAARDAFYKNAAGMGLSVSERRSFDTLWNGVSVNVSAADAGLLATVPGVKAVYHVSTTLAPAAAVPLVSGLDTDGQVAFPSTGNTTIDLAHSTTMIGSNLANASGWTGLGVKVAIIDSGIDYTHPDLGGCFGVGCKVVGGWDFVGNTFDSNSTDSTYQPIPHPDADPAPCDANLADQIAQQPGAGTSDAAHGTHVAGITAAKAASATGVTGVAPNATLLAYRVFGCNGSTSDDIMIAALERAYSDGARVVNMSIGDAFNNFADSPDAAVSSALVQNGVVVVASAGNSGANGLYSTGAPSVGRGVISVASVQNLSFPAPSFDVVSGATTMHVGYLALATTVAAPTSGAAGNIVWAGRGCLNAVASPPLDAAGNPQAPVPAGGDPYLASVSGNVALLVRGVCSFNEKYARAVAAGATAVVIMNDGFTPDRRGIVAGGGVVDLGKPGVTISWTDGIVLQALAQPAAMTWTANTVDSPDPVAGQISSFSSWGMASDLALKPDVSAPGGNIRSTWPLVQDGGYNVISGTSMAAPHVTGSAADYLQAHPLATPAAVQAALQNTSTPVINSTLGSRDGADRQGSGLININNAISAPASVSPSTISLGDGHGGSATLTLTNNTAAAITYAAGNSSALVQEPFLSDGVTLGHMPYTFGQFFFGNGVSFTGLTTGRVTVPAGGSATVGATIAEPGWDDRTLYGGFLSFTPVGGGQVLRVPYGGFVGDYQAIDPIQSGSCSLPTLAHFGSATDSIACDTGIAAITGFTAARTGGTWSQTKTDPVVLLWHLDHQVQQLTVTLVDASTLQPVTDGNRNPVLYQIDRVARDATPTGFGGFVWDGRSTFVDNGNGAAHTKAVPAGDYRLVLNAVKTKSLTDSRPNQAQTWTSPVISLH